MKLKIFCLLVLFTLSNSFSQISFDKVRESEKLEHSILLSVKNNWLDYELDDRQVEQTLDTVDYFQVKGDEFRLYVKFVNPLKYRFTADNKTVEDELQKASKEFITSSVEFLSENGIVRTASSKRAIVNPAGVPYTLEGELAELYSIAIAIDSNIFSGPNLALKEAMFKLNFIETQDIISKTLDESFEKLKSIDSISKIQQHLDGKIKLFSDLEKEINKLNKNVKSLEEKFDVSTIKTMEGLSQLFNYKIDNVKNNVISFKKTFQDLKNKYSIILNYFNSINDKGYPKENKFLLKNITKIKSQKRNELKVKLEKLEFNEKEKTLSVKKTYDFLLHIRKATTFIPVVSSGVIYSNLSFPQFGTDEDENGNTIVTQTAEEDNEIAVGAYLNLYLNNQWETPVFAQFGIGPSKKKPLFFVGVGFSLFEKITLSTGGVFTWFPELSELAIGQQVSGTSEIEKDISFSFRTTPKFYVGLSFDITKK